MPLQPRPEVRNLEPCAHGSKNYAELRALGLDAEKVLDFSVNTNPFMPPAKVKKALNAIPFEQYPDPEAIELRKLLSKRLRLVSDYILVGSGTTELIRLVALTYFGKGDSVLILGPTYGEYDVACKIVGAQPVVQLARAEDNFRLKLTETSDLIGKHHPKGVFICNPNNPTGKYLSGQEIKIVLEAIGDGLLVLDEAYISFVEKSWPSTDLVPRGNVVILRSMTKDYSLAGLRLGYAIATPDIIENLSRLRPPWNVNIVAQKVGALALINSDHLERSKEKIRETKQFLTDELSRLDFSLFPSDVNFFLMKVGDAQAFRAALLRRGILVRDCTSFGLPEYVRIAPRTMPECKKLIDAIRALKHE